MTTIARTAAALLTALLWAVGAGAQEPPAGGQLAPPPAAVIPQAASSDAASPAARPATTTFFGDTGVWFVPIAEVLPDRSWSGSGYRRGTNYIQGYTSVADVAGTFAIGVAGRIELFGSVIANTTLIRDLTPVFVNDRAYGGFVDRYPRVATSSPVRAFGDSYLGVKLNLLSEHRGDLVAVALRSVVKLPTADEQAGAGTGKADVSVDAISSKVFAGRLEAAAMLGYTFQGQPTGFTTPSGVVTWGGAAVYPARGAIRIFGEASGSVLSSDMALRGEPLVGVDGSIAPTAAATENMTRIGTGLTWQLRGGLFLGAGVNWTGPRRERNAANQTDHTFGDYRDWQIRIGFHPGVHQSTPRPSGR